MKKFSKELNYKYNTIKKDSGLRKIFEYKEEKEIYELELDKPIYSRNETNSYVANFFSKLFESREVAHIYHLQVKGDDGSYSKHETLGEYYEEIIEMIDELIEVYQGQYDVVEGYNIINNSGFKDIDIVEYFIDLADFIKNNRINFKDDDTHLHSLIDDIVCLVYKTLYKLRFTK